MSNLVDERIVEMSFDNKNFEKNVKNSMNTIDQLKSSLNFSGVSSSMKNNLNSIDTSGITAGLTAASNGFSMMEIVAINAISNITNRVIDLGINMVKSLSIDNINAGWEKYAEKTSSVATLFAQGYDMDTVNEQLEKLNWFTDETSYSFTDMVSNISKFTASGQGLEESVAAMMGIANWAALSGQNAATASRAMYQLSQAMGTGTIKLADWKSIQNANMDTQEFRQKALDAAVAAGTLSQAIDGTYTTLSGKTFDINQFTKNLTEDGWFTTDVLMSALGEYSSAVDVLYEKVKSDDSISTTSQAISKYGSELDEFGLKAFRAAQEAKTFRDAISSVKDAVASGWMNTFENIFGSYDKAKVLWTDLANELYDVFVEGLNVNNEILKGWSELGGRDDLFINTEEETGAFWNLFYALVDIRNAISDAWQTIFPKKTSEELKSFTERLKEITAGLRLSEESAEKLTNVFKGVFSIIKLFINILKSAWIGIQPLLNLVKTLIGQLIGALGLAGNGFSEFVSTTNIFIKAGQKIAEILSIIIEEIKSLGVIQSVVKMVKTFGDSFKKNGGNADNFKKILNGVKTVVEALLKIFISLYNFTKEYIFPMFLSLLNFAAKLLGAFGGKIISAFAWIADLIIIFINFVKTSTMVNKIVTVLKKTFASLFIAITNFFGSFKKVDTSGVDDFNEDVTNKFDPLTTVLKGLTSLFTGLWSIVKPLIPILSKAMEFVGKLLKSFGEKLSSIFGGDGGLNFSKIISMSFLIYVAKSIADVIYMFKGIANALTDVLGSFSDVVYSKALMQYAEALKTFAIGILILVAALVLISMIDDAQLKRSLAVLVVLLGAFAVMMVVMKKITETTKFLGAQSLITAMSMKMTTQAMLKIAIAVAILALSLKLLATMDQEQILNGLTGLISIMALLLGASAIIGKNEKVFRKGARGLIGMAVAVLLLSIPLKSIGNMDPDKLNRGLIGISTLVGLCVLFARASGNAKRALSTSMSMILFAEALLIAVIPLKIISGMGWKKLAIGLVGIVSLAGIMILLGTMSKYMKKTLFTSYSMIQIGTALLLASIPLRIIGSMGWSKLIIGMTGMLGVAGIMILLGTMSKYMKKTIITAMAMVIVGTAMIEFAIAAKIFGSMKWSSLQKAGIAMFGIAVIMVMIGKIFSGKTSVAMISFSVSLTIISAALILFSIAVATLSFSSFKNLGKALLILVSVFALFGLAALALKPVVPTILALAVSMILFAGAILMISVALTLLITTFGIFGTSLTTMLTLIAKAIINSAPVIALAIGALLSAIFQGLTVAIKELFILLDVLIVNILKFLIDHGPSIIDTVIMLLANLLVSLAEYFPIIVKSLVSMVITLLEALRESIGQIIDIVIDILLNLLQAIINRLPEIIKKLGEMAVKIIESLVETIVKLIPRLADASFDLIIGLINGLGESIEKNATKLRDAMIKFCQHLLNAFLSFFGMKTEKSESTSFIQIGAQLIAGIISGLMDGVKNIGGVIKNVGNSIVDGFKSFFGIKSPSRLMAELGMYLDQGLAKGIHDNSDEILNSAESLGDDVTEGLNNSGITKIIQKLYDTLNSDMDGELVIRPVMDLTEIQNGKKNLFKMMKNVDGYSINGSNDIVNRTAYDVKTKKTDKINKLSEKQNNLNKEELQQNFYNTFNISGAVDPKEVAEEVSEIIQLKINRRKVKNGKPNI